MPGARAAGRGRVDQPARAPRALGEDEARRLLRAARRTGSTLGRALLALCCPGPGCGWPRPPRIVDDVPTTERTGTVHVRAGKRGAAAHRPAAGRRPRPAAVLAHRACPAPGRPAGRARPVAGSARPPVRPAAAAHRRRAGRRRPVGGRQRVHPAAHRGDPMAARRRRRGRGRGLLGHASLDTTRTYALPTDRELAAAVEAAAVKLLGAWVRNRLP